MRTLQRDLTGQVFSDDPYGMPMRRLRPSWSVFPRRRVIASPALENSRSSTFNATSSERRKAPAKPSSSSARSLSPTRVLGILVSMRFRSDTTADALPVWAVPSARRMPAWVRRTCDEVVGEGRSAALWACEITTRRRATVAALKPASASSAAGTCHVERWRPNGKDWNEVLMEFGIEALTREFQAVVAAGALSPDGARALQ
jgi:hypothetical protein